MKTLKLLSKRALLMALPAILAGSLHGQLYLTVGVTQPPTLTAEAGPGGSVCPGDSLMLGGAPTADGGTSPFTYDWTPALSGANPYVSPTGSATYTLLVTDANNCTSSDTVAVGLEALPSAAFTSSTSALVASFSDASTGGVVSWAWDFGDGGSSTVANPTHTYAADGVYLVCLTVQNGAGCESTTCDSITVVAVGSMAPQASAAFQVYPNPWAGSAIIQMDIPAAASARLEVVDLQGRILTVLHEGSLKAGHHQFELKESHLGGVSGAHVVRLTLNGKSTSQTIINLH